MPRFNEISEESNRIRKMILDLCKEPKIADEMRSKLKCTKNQLAFNLRSMLSEKQISIVCTKRNANDRKCFAYLATGAEFVKAVKVKPVIQIHVPQVVEIKPIEYKPIIKQVNETTRMVYLADYVKNKGTSPKLNAWARPFEGTAFV